MDTPPEHAEGRNQLDYLRRLAVEIDRLDRDTDHFAAHGVQAIGIVGSDVYDKLLILQALRGRFKDKIFFTTDLDARYLHADQKDWARNLVVASNFDLSLRPALQYFTPPFRDSYQTAAYLATLMALDSSKPFDYWTGRMTEWMSPQIFEIGRTEAVHLASPSVQRSISRVIIAVAVVSMTLAAFWFLMNDSLEQGVGEPFVWLEGISVWPSLILRFVGLVLMVVFTCSCYFWIRHQTKHISKDFSLGRPGTQSHTRKWWDSVRTGPYLDLGSFDKKGNANAKSVEGKKRVEERIDVAALWRNYLRATSFREMVGWIIASLLIGLVLAFAAFQVLDRPSFPHRGELVKQLHLILVSFNALVLWPIIFWVGYETRACTRFIETLSGARSL